VHDLAVANEGSGTRDDPWQLTTPPGGWYGLEKGFRGRFANYVPPVLERLGLAEVEHNPRTNRIRAR
jgi:hypothetical protein